MKNIVRIIKKLFKNSSHSAPTANSNLTQHTSCNAEQFADFINKTDVQIVDVRTSREYARGHMKNAINIDVLSVNFREKAKDLKKDSALAVYCQSGGRSKRAAKILSKIGFKPIVELEEGLITWPFELEK